MKTRSFSARLPAALIVVFVLNPGFSAVRELSTDDRAAHLLAHHGAVPVQAAGPYVSPGTFRIQVFVKLGRPDVVLANGTWLYHGRAIEGSAASGTLVIRFEQGRVSELSLASPAVIAALRANPRQPLPSEHVVTGGPWAALSRRSK